MSLAKNELLLWAGLGVVGLVALSYLAKKTGDAASAIGGGIVTGAKAVGTAINPVSTDNLAYQGTSAVAGVFADYKGATVGSMFADTFKPSSEQAVDAMLSKTPTAPARSPSTFNWFRSDAEKEVDALYRK